MRVRAYRDADGPALAAIFRAAVRDSGPDAYPWSAVEAWSATAADEAAFARRLAQGTTLVAETATGEAAAFGQLEPLDRVAMLYTAPGYARASYAAAVYRLLEDRARRGGVRALTTESSLVARPFFERQGFVPVEHERVTRHGVAIDRVRMRKALDAG